VNRDEHEEEERNSHTNIHDFERRIIGRRIVGRTITKKTTSRRMITENKGNEGPTVMETDGRMQYIWRWKGRTKASP